VDVHIEAEEARGLCVGIRPELAVEMGLPRYGRQEAFVSLGIGFVLSDLVREELHVHVVEQTLEVLSRQGLRLVVRHPVYIIGIIHGKSSF